MFLSLCKLIIDSKRHVPNNSVEFSYWGNSFCKDTDVSQVALIWGWSQHMCMYFCLKTWQKWLVPGVVQKNSVLRLKRWLERGEIYEEVQKMIGCLAKMISDALKWKAKSERRGRKRKTIIQMARRLARMANIQPMISSRRRLRRSEVNGEQCDT